jgi:hypothetical protein
VYIYVYSTFFWVGKDYCWNTGFFELWVVFTVPTVLVAIDFVYVTWKKKVLSLSEFCGALESVYAPLSSLL